MKDDEVRNAIERAREIAEKHFHDLVSARLTDPRAKEAARVLEAVEKARAEMPIPEHLARQHLAAALRVAEQITPEMRDSTRRIMEKFAAEIPPSRPGSTPTINRASHSFLDYSSPRQKCERPHVDEMQTWNPPYSPGGGPVN
jgi:hypothetical protein